MKAIHELRLRRVKEAIDEENLMSLSDVDQRYAARLLTVAGMLLAHDTTTSDVLNALKNEHGITERSAYMDIADAKIIFGDVFKSDRAVERMQAINRAEHLYRVAMNQKVPDLEAALKANKQIIELRGLMQDDTKAIDPTMLEPSIYKLAMPRDVHRTLRQLLDGGRVDLADLLRDVPEAQLLPPTPDTNEDDEEETDADAR
jgi:hypothetical protein